MKDQINENELKQHINSFDFWHLYKYDRVHNRSLEFNQKKQFRVFFGSEIKYAGYSLSDAVSTFNWF